MRCSCATPGLHRQKTPGRTCHETFIQCFCFAQRKSELKSQLVTIFCFVIETRQCGITFFFKSSVQQEDTRIFLFATPSLSRKETTGRSCSRNIQFRARHLHGDSFFSPPLQAMSRSSSVEGHRDIPARRGVELIIFLGQEGCQGLQEDRRGNQSSHGK